MPCNRNKENVNTIDGEKIRNLRKDMHLSQAKLALEIDTEQQVISKIENNRVPYITYQMVCRLADFLKIPIDNLRK